MGEAIEQPGEALLAHAADRPGAHPLTLLQYLFGDLLTQGEATRNGLLISTT
jgi:hypothetical protein